MAPDLRPARRAADVAAADPALAAALRGDDPAAAAPPRRMPQGSGRAAAPATDRPAWPLPSAAALRAQERAAAATLPPHQLMARAGVALARLARALAPHGRQAWVLAGPGNNGGDGLLTGLLLQAAGWTVLIDLLDEPRAPDARWALGLAQAAGVALRRSGALQPPSGLGPEDLAVDALLGLGLGSARPLQGRLAEAVLALNHSPAPVLAVDLPSGLDADTGHAAGPCVQARWTLSLLRLKPGLWTGAGRDAAGSLWLHDLGVPAAAEDPDEGDGGPAVAPVGAGPSDPPLDLLDGPGVAALWPTRPHAAHKGRQGDLWVVGGATGMDGAVQLAARAGLAAGAGRVHLVPLGGGAGAPHPALMHRPLAALLDESAALARATVVAGCGGGSAMAAALPGLIDGAPRLLLDADALNAVAADAALAQRLRQRGVGRTLLSPHPLEAARLLGQDVATVQADRPGAARRLAGCLGATVVLKGSGSVIAQPDGRAWINASGNAALAGPGTGDVLAGWVGGLWAQGLPAAAALRLGVWSHGAAADAWQGARGPGDAGAPLDALRLIEALLALPRH